MKIQGKMTIEPIGEREIRAVRSFDAPRRLVWECFVQPALLQRWMLGPPDWEMPVCEIDLRVGGKFRYLWRHVDGREMGQLGSFKEVSPPDRIVHGERFDGMEEANEAIVTTVFTEKAGKTTTVMTMLFPTNAIREQALGYGMETGMEAGYERLDAILAEKARAA